MRVALGFDVGTQGTKGLAIDLDQPRILARGARRYGLIEGLPAGHAEQHPATWIEALSSVARELLGARAFAPAEVVAVGVSGQQHGLVVLDAAGEVVRPAKLWCDTSTAGEARELSRELGRAVPAGFTAPKIRWLARHEPENWARTARVFLPHDYVNWRLTARATMEAGDASGTGFFDPLTRTFDARAVTCVDARLAARLPPLIAPGEPAGELDAKGAALLGLSPGVLVAAGGGDNMLSAIGAGATRAGVVVASLGTSGTVFAHSEAPIVDPAGLIAPFCGSAGGWLPLLCVMNMTGVVEEVCAAFRADHATLAAAARAVPLGCDGLLWLPYLVGERVPDLPGASATLLGLRTGHLRAAVLYRAALEGTSLNLALGVERLRALGIRPEELRLVGGAAQNDLWRSILADVLGVRVVALAEPESAALGAALQAAWTWRRTQGAAAPIDEIAAPYIAVQSDATDPDAERMRAYAALLDRFRAAVATQYGV